MKNLQYIFLVLVLAFGGNAFASSKVTVEAGVVANIASAMRLFEKMNGHLPTNWMQVSQIIDLNVINRQSLINSSAFPLQEHYVFVTKKIPMLDSQEGNVFLIRTAPVEETERTSEGRYVIAWGDKGVHYTWLSETNVQQMLANAGVTELPKPEPVSQTTNPNTTPTPETYHQVTNAVNKLEPSVNPSPSRGVQVTIQSTNPVEPSNSASTPDVQAKPVSESSPIVKPLLIALTVILALAAAFVLLRSKK